MNWGRCALLASLALLCGPTQAAELFDPEDGMLDMSETLRDSPYGFLPIPLLITEPAVGYGGGLFGLFLHGKGSQQGDRFIPPAMTAVGGGGTENGTWFVGAAHRHTWQDDHIRYLVGAGYADINMDIYSGDVAGFGGNRAINTTTRGVGGLQKLQFRVADTPLFIGVSQVWTRVDVSAENPLINRLWQRVLGEQSTTSGIGVLAAWDTTNNLFWPTRGTDVSAEYRMYGSLLGGDYRYDTLTVDGKYFLPLAPTLTLALAADYQSLTHADPHLTPMARPYIELRGIPRFRWQGDYVGTAQTQLSWQVDPRWIVQGFVGAGSAADGAGELFDETKVAWGSGFRYLIARAYGLHTGIDIAFSGGDRAVYFNVGSGL